MCISCKTNFISFFVGIFFHVDLFLIKPWSLLGFSHYIPWPHPHCMTPSARKQTPYLYCAYWCKTYGRDVTRTSHTSRMSFRVLSRFVLKNDVDLYTVCVFFMDFRGCEGTGASFWVSHLYPGSTRSFKTMPSMWIHLLGGVTWFLCPNMGIVTSVKSHGLYAWFWLVEKISAALWLVGTQWSPMYYYQHSALNKRMLWPKTRGVNLPVNCGSKAASWLIRGDSMLCR